MKKTPSIHRHWVSRLVKTLSFSGSPSIVAPVPILCLLYILMMYLIFLNVNSYFVCATL